MSHDAFCPHCGTLLCVDAPDLHPAQPTRCGSCRLVVGRGRARARDGRPLAAPPQVRSLRPGTRIGTGIDAPTLPDHLIRAVLRGVDSAPVGR